MTRIKTYSKTINRTDFSDITVQEKKIHEK
jgi:hypothetical protein